MKTAHLITGLNRGGAENMLYKLMTNRQYLPGEQIVISMLSGCAMEEEFRSLHVKIYTLGMKRSALAVASLFTLVKILQAECVDVLQTWMYHADLLGLLVYRLSRIKYLIWNIRCADLDLSKYSLLTRLVVYSCAKLAGIPNAIIVNSEKGIETHKLLGYKPKRWELIYNGFDLDKYKICDYGEKMALRQKYCIPEDAFVFGMAARYDPAKDFETLFRSIDYFYKDGVDHYRTIDKKIIFVICGKGVSCSNIELMDIIKKYSLENRVILLGELSTVVEFYAILNVFILSSATEGFSNVLGEAMACGLPTVVTNAGDNGKLASDIGYVVNTKDYQGLAEGYKNIMLLDDQERNKIAVLSRNRIVNDYSIESIAKKYGELYIQIMQ